jgi:NAD(P)-dependent dehydrogenase (short-subunit alcohol dehydrogenase family)
MVVTRLDALVNNAGIGGGSINGDLAQQISGCFQTNATGALLMVDAFASLLKKSTGTPRVVNVSITNISSKFVVVPERWLR